MTSGTSQHLCQRLSGTHAHIHIFRSTLMMLRAVGRTLICFTISYTLNISTMSSDLSNSASFMSMPSSRWYCSLACSSISKRHITCLMMALLQQHRCGLTMAVLQQHRCGLMMAVLQPHRCGLMMALLQQHRCGLMMAVLQPHRCGLMMALLQQHRCCLMRPTTMTYLEPVHCVWRCSCSQQPICHSCEKPRQERGTCRAKISPEAVHFCR